MGDARRASVATYLNQSYRIVEASPARPTRAKDAALVRRRALSRERLPFTVLLLPYHQNTNVDGIDRPVAPALSLEHEAAVEGRQGPAGNFPARNAA
jgi:hypothetical protein